MLLQTKWFDRLGAELATEIPIHWPESYQKLVLKRIELIKQNKNIGLIEQTGCKRRWEQEPWNSQLERALQTWLLNRLESYFDLDGRLNDTNNPTAHITTPTLISTAKLTDIASQDTDFLQVGELYRNDPAFKVQTLIDDLTYKAAVPHLPILRYKPTGLRKRQDWQHTWHRQRQEDSIGDRTQLPPTDPDYLDTTAANHLKATEIGPIPVPPKYTSTDFLKTHHWKLRGKLDVPKERWLSFPHCKGPDGLPVIAWAGYDPLQLAQAISTYYMEVKERFGGTGDPRLTPRLASLIELLPWLKQWHNAPSAEFDGQQMGDYYETFIQDEAKEMSTTPAAISTWQPPAKAKKTKSKRKQ